MIYRAAPHSATLNDQLPPISTSNHHLMLNISGTVRDRDTDLMEYYTLYSTVSFRVTLTDLLRLSKVFDDAKHRAASLRQLSFLSSFGLSGRSASSAIAETESRTHRLILRPRDRLIGQRQRTCLFRCTMT